MAQFLDTAWITKKIERKTVNAFYQKQNVKPENFEEHHRISRFKMLFESSTYREYISETWLPRNRKIPPMINILETQFYIIRDWFPS